MANSALADDSPPTTPGDNGTSATSGSCTSASSSANQQSSSSERKKLPNKVQWAGKIADNTTDFAAKTAENITTGVTQLVGWTYENTKVESRGLRPMHVRVSVRVHHVSFLHPGLDSGNRATISDTKKSTFGKKYKKDTGPPGLLKFGKKSASWKNPGTVDLKNQLKEAAKDVPWHKSQEDNTMDPSDVADIVNAEAFRLSRDGIIQQHFALEQALLKSGQTQQKQQSYRRNSPTRFSVPQVPMHLSPTAAAANPTQYNYTSEGSVQSNPYSSMLSPESMADPEGAARYYKQCAARPKGYRRLVVSSLPQRNDVSVPVPPKSKSMVQNLSSSVLALSPRTLAGLGEGSFSFETNTPAKDGQAIGSNRPEKNDCNSPKGGGNKEHNFDNVEYRYVGPPKTGPEFFQLLRKHGAATFGRYLPELACSVPNHSYNFELIKSKRRSASTQPIVYECPHVIWGDARDKMLSRIAKEGCPLIDARPFEYASNSNLDDARLSESLLLCGSTLWVKRAKDEGDDKGDKLVSKNKKTLVEAEYHASRFYDGIKDGVKGGVKGVKVGTKAVMKGAQEVVGVVGKGTQDVVEVGGMILPRTNVKSSGEKEKKKSKFRSIFHSKKRKQKRNNDDGMSVDDSLVSGQDDDSVASEQVPIPSLQLSDHIGTVDEEDEDKGKDEGTVKKITGEQKSTVKLQSSSYVLLLDDIIHIRIVSFPDKIEIAKFPISVASVMVQRSMEDRLNDPFKPSELTCNFIQEPSAPELRWGVTLKVTVRAVQVRPSKVPRMLLSPKINEKLSAGKAELKRFKDKLKSLGKDDEEVMKELAKREEEISKEESELDKAIVAYGYEKNEDSEYGPNEIRLRQMFYCAREHESIIQKAIRRLPLTADEIRLISDASLDPTSATNKSYEMDELDELLRLLEINFPGIDDEMYVSKMRKSLTSSLSPGSGSEEAISLSDDAEPSANDVFAAMSLAMAESLDKCFGDDIGATKTAEAVRQQIFTSSTMERKKLDADASKLWMSRVSKKLSLCLHDGTTIARVQKVLLESVMGDDNAVEEEMKMDEDQLTLSESDESGDVDAAELADWCIAVASKLEECVMELEAMYSSSKLALSDHSSVDDNETTKDRNDVRPEPPSRSRSTLLPTIRSMASKRSDDDLLEGVRNRRLFVQSDISTSQRSISTIDEALPKSTQLSKSKADELLKKMKDAHFMKRKSSRYGSKTCIVSELEDAQREKKRVDAFKVHFFYAMLVVFASTLVIYFFWWGFSSSLTL